MFRFNNPDALLTLLLMCAAYATTRALERGSTTWLVAAGTCIGFGFLTKMLQAWAIVPGFTLVYLVAANTTLRRRIWQLALAALAVLVSSLWWVVVVMAIPASSRPYIGGSQTNSLWDLIFGYNGFGRLTGNETGSVGGGGQPGSMWGPTGWTRMFNDAFGGQIAWLLPAALVFLVALIAFTWRAPRTDRTRSAVLLWGSWLVVTGALFSLSQGIIHPYYTVALAPAIGALVGIGATFLWRRRHHPACRAVLAITMGATAVCAFELLQRTPDWQPWLAPTILIGALAIATALLVRPWLTGRSGRVIAALGVVIALAGTSSYAFATATTDHGGAIPSAGPASTAGFGRFGPFARLGAPRAGGLGGVGSLLTGSAPTAELTHVLQADAGSYTWVAATIGSNSASGYQLATGDPVMSIGGFNGTDPAPTLAQFQSDVASGQIHYFIAAGGRGRGFSGGSTSGQIESWVTRTFPAKTVGGITIYDLSA
jgi:4-amino-4-deoxy-L-arabinose transferase-like glycosyltransferase